MKADGLSRLADVLSRARRCLVLTGAGCSTESGIPDYRDEEGNWKHAEPVRFADFARKPAVRARYWARSYAGWPSFTAARPNPAHHALADLERCGLFTALVTQNVDGLHQAGGSQNVIDLHGRLDRVECLGCGKTFARDWLQSELAERNPGFETKVGRVKPDGDADLAGVDPSSFNVVDCPACGGILKPSVVFFGENVPRERVDRAFSALFESDLLLVAGSSLMVFSGYRFARKAVERGTPVAVVNLGKTRIDAAAKVKLVAACGAALPAVASRLGARQGGSANSRDAADAGGPGD